MTVAVYPNFVAILWCGLADGVIISDRVVNCIGWEQEQVSFESLLCKEDKQSPVFLTQDLNNAAVFHDIRLSRSIRQER